jgi:hypothetical protein
MHQLQEKPEGKWIAAIIGLVLAGVAILLTTGAVNGDPGLAIGALIVGAIAALLLGAALSSFWVGMKVKKPEIVLSSEVARPGEVVTMRYSQQFKRSMQLNRLSFQLIFRETAIYQRGTDTVTVTHDVVIDEFGQPGRHVRRGEVVQDEWRVLFPANSMHTFKARRNRLEWYLRVNVDMPGLFDFKRDYEVTVLPEQRV